MLTSIAGRSVIVTGASKGIGKGIARVFASQGAKVLIVARTGADAEATAAEIGHGASGFAADVTVFDADTAWTVDASKFRSKGRNTPYAGQTLRGIVELTVVGGKVIHQRGR